MAIETILASPTKRLFIETLTQDVSLQTCILDLIDNSYDSYVRNKITVRKNIKIDFSKDHFELFDNCGGIDKDHLKTTVFKFGNENKSNDNPTLGMYGIGMKRSIFKIGNDIDIETDDGKNYCRVKLDVLKWQESPDWNIEFNTEGSKLSDGESPFTKIFIQGLHEDVSNKFTLVTFKNEVINALKRVYCLIIQENIDFEFNSQKVDSDPILIPDDQNYSPNIHSERYGNMDIKIICFVEPNKGKRLQNAVNQIGWNLFCNKRLILANDISETTGWVGGAQNKGMLPKYHSIYNEFRGLVFLTSNNPFELPLNTSKSGLNEEDKNYHYVLNKMVLTARPIVDYLTDKYKPELQEEEAIEQKIEEKIDNESTQTKYSKIEEILTKQSTFSAPRQDTTSQKSTTVNINYRKEKKLVEQVMNRLSVNSYKEVGEQTFDYYCKMEDLS